MPDSPGARAPHRALVAGAVTLAVAGASLGAPLVRPVAAQPVLGGGDDATLPARGQARVRGLVLFSNATERFGGASATGQDDRREPLGADFSTPSFGPAQYAPLGRVRSALRDITGVQTLDVSIGSVRTTASAATLVVPLTAEFGITRRLALGVTVPLVRTLTTVGTQVNAGTPTGNVGFNPAAGDDATAVRNRNGTVVGAVSAAAAALQQRIAGCPGSGDPVCGRLPDAAALVAQAQRAAAGVRSVYGDSTRAGAGFVPVAGSDAQQAVVAALGALAGRFAGDYGITTLSGVPAPAPSLARLGGSGFDRVLSDPAFGLSADTLQTVQRASIGDIELTASVQWLDTFGRDPAARRRPRGLRLRSTVTAGYRIGSGNGDIPFVLLETPPATGAPALLVRSATDLVAGRHGWATVVVRYTRPIADRVIARVPGSPEDVFVPLWREREVGRRLGDELQVELLPRWSFGESFAVWGAYLLRAKQADAFTGRFTADSTETGLGTAVTFDAAPLGLETRGREQRAGLGVVYSTMAAFARGRSRLPVEVSWLHSETLAGAGGAVPRLSIDQLSLRVYAQLLNRRRR